MRFGRQLVAMTGPIALSLISSAVNRLFCLAAAAVATSCLLRSSPVLASCQLPEQWQGLWYEGDIGDVTITSTNVTKKGVCLQQSNNFYLFENLEIGCYTCLLFGQRHRNLLQYKESFCIGKETLGAVCSTIHPETVQRTLIREPSGLTPCPLHDAFHLVYNNNSGGFCQSPSSYVSPCASQAELRFHFEQCEHIAYTYTRDVNLDCLATWSDGNDQYLFGRLRGPGFVRKNDQYRCFMYQIRGTVVLAAMSADSSCRGLRSPTNGPVLLELTQDVMGWPQLSCQYPDWVTRTPWRDLDGRSFFRSDPTSKVIRLHFRPGVESDTSVLQSFRCHRPTGGNTTSDQFTAVVFASNACTSQFQCIKFVRRKEVIEVIKGRLMNYASDRCTDVDLVEGSKRILIPEDTTAGPCPLEGRHSIHTGSTHCRSYFRSGCNGSSIIEIISSCSSRPGLQLQCLLSWEEGKKRILIARTLDGKQTNCFSFRYEENQIRFAIDPECNSGTVPIFRDRITYVMDRKELMCDFLSKSIQDLAPSIQSTIIEHDNQYAGTYGVVANATRQVRKQKTRQESTNSNLSIHSDQQRILLTCLASVVVRIAVKR